MFTMSRRSVARLALPSLFVAGLGVACGSDEAPPGAPPEVYFDSGPTAPLPDATILAPKGTPCVEGTMKVCKVLLPAHGPVHPCFVGVQICINGELGDCVERPEAGAASPDGSAVN